jgi:hypothetical protein
VRRFAISENFKAMLDSLRSIAGKNGYAETQGG